MFHINFITNEVYRTFIINASKIDKNIKKNLSEEDLFDTSFYDNLT